jgi:hypothetical protein
VAVGDFDLQAVFDGAQVLVGRAAQVRQAGVVVRGKGVAQDHADNSKTVKTCKACPARSRKQRRTNPP